MEWLTTEALVALMMLTMLEIILGIDNVVFISILMVWVHERPIKAHLHHSGYQ